MEQVVLNMQIVDGVTDGVPIEGVIEGITFGLRGGGGGFGGFGNPLAVKTFTVTRLQDEFSNRLFQLFITSEVLDESRLLRTRSATFRLPPVWPRLPMPS